MLACICKCAYMHVCAGAWGLSQGSRRVVVAVIDTGVDGQHPDLADNMWSNAQEVRDEHKLTHNKCNFISMVRSRNGTLTCTLCPFPAVSPLECSAC